MTRGCLNNKKYRGIALTEVILGAAVAGIILVGISHTLTLFLKASNGTLEQTKALYLAEEGHELLRYIRDENWNTLDGLTTGTTYYLTVSTTTIGTTTTPEVIDTDYTRSFVLNNLNRDSNDDFVESGGSSDPDSRIVTVTVSWGSKSVTLDSILTNIFDI